MFGTAYKKDGVFDAERPGGAGIDGSIAGAPEKPKVQWYEPTEEHPNTRENIQAYIDSGQAAKDEAAKKKSQPKPAAPAAAKGGYPQTYDPAGNLHKYSREGMNESMKHALDPYLTDSRAEADKLNTVAKGLGVQAPGYAAKPYAPEFASPAMRPHNTPERAEAIRKAAEQSVETGVDVPIPPQQYKADRGVLIRKPGETAEEWKKRTSGGPADKEKPDTIEDILRQMQIYNDLANPRVGYRAMKDQIKRDRASEAVGYVGDLASKLAMMFTAPELFNPQQPSLGRQLRAYHERVKQQMESGDANRMSTAYRIAMLRNSRESAKAASLARAAQLASAQQWQQMNYDLRKEIAEQNKKNAEAAQKYQEANLLLRQMEADRKERDMANRASGAYRHGKSGGGGKKGGRKGGKPSLLSTAPTWDPSSIK